MWELKARHLVGRNVPWEIPQHFGWFWIEKKSWFWNISISYNWKYQIASGFSFKHSPHQRLESNTELQNNSQGREQPATIISPFSTCTNLPRSADKAKFASPRMMTKPAEMGQDPAILMGREGCWRWKAMQAVSCLLLAVSPPPHCSCQKKGAEEAQAQKLTPTSDQQLLTPWIDWRWWDLRELTQCWGNISDPSFCCHRHCLKL